MEEKTKKLITAAKEAYILILEQIERMDDESAEEILERLHKAIQEAERES